MVTIALSLRTQSLSHCHTVIVYTTTFKLALCKLSTQSKSHCYCVHSHVYSATLSRCTHCAHSHTRSHSVTLSLCTQPQCHFGHSELTVVVLSLKPSACRNRLDESIANLLCALQRNLMADNTLLVIASDNGSYDARTGAKFAN